MDGLEPLFNGALKGNIEQHTKFKYTEKIMDINKI